ncbi:patatin-like phospholipase family protein [Rhizobium laguerreae]|uniref:patatin-like phospholipase family protein n=1 Tax=Rhizobium laguerreae TaxID=1076926 RepID=UPI001C91E5FA|nr:patatin-like phospholipase family protein [Rhizobium laguerreae]MBY3489433.1 patatin-like phospholipase family protein [Rhizobium laguerreae]
MKLGLRLQLLLAAGLLSIACYDRSFRPFALTVVIFTFSLLAPGRILGKLDLLYKRDLCYFIVALPAVYLIVSTFGREVESLATGEFIEYFLRILIVTFVTSAGTWWVLSSTVDPFLESNRYRSLIHLPEAQSPDLMRVAICLSGGGYRAALFHAGVLDAATHFKLFPTRISAVSGGAIVGAAYALGIHTSNFPRLILTRHLDLKRRLFRIQHVVALIVNRSHAQSALLDRVLFRTRRFSDLRKNVQLLVGCTDLLRGTGVGVSATFWIRQLHVSLPDKLRSSNLVRKRPIDIVHFLHTDFLLSKIVAASGAFPLAFNALPVRFSARQDHECLLADGGIIDNTGINLLLSAHRYAAEPPSIFDALRYAPDLDDWRLDLILVSDGGASFKDYHITDRHIQSRLLRDFGRAVDLIHSNVAPRWEASGAEDPTVAVISAGAWIDQLRMVQMELGIDSSPHVSLSGTFGVQSAKTWAYLVSNLPLSDKVDVPAATQLGLIKYGNELQSPQKLGRKLLQQSLQRSGRGILATVDESDLDRLIMYDLLACATTFIHTSTLRANFDVEEIDRLFRLGRYLFGLERDKIRKIYVFLKREHLRHRRIWKALSSHSTARREDLQAYFRFEYAYYRLQQRDDQSFWVLGEFDKYASIPRITTRNIAAMLSFRIAQLEAEREPTSLVMFIRGTNKADSRRDISRLLCRSADLCGEIGFDRNDFVEAVFSLVVTAGSRHLPYELWMWLHERGKEIPI